MTLLKKVRNKVGLRINLVKFLEKSGYWVHPKTKLPVGADFAQDVTNKLGLSPGVIFDVGANYGQTAIYFAEKFPAARINSFEPIKRSYEQLLSNTKHLTNVSCYQTAVGDVEGTVEVSLYDEKQSYLNSLKPSHSNLKETAIKETVSVTTIDSFVELNDTKEIDLLKIDTEGYEIEVLTGARNTIEQAKVKLILCEISLAQTNKRNTALIDIIKFLEPYNYGLVGLYDTELRFMKEGLAYSNALFIKI